MLILLKRIYILNAIPIEIQTDLLVEISELILPWKCNAKDLKYPRQFWEKNKVGGYILLDIKIY